MLGCISYLPLYMHTYARARREKEIIDLEERLKFKEETLRNEESVALQKKSRQLSQLEKNSVLESSEFRDFFSKSSRTIERALMSVGGTYDITIDYNSDDAVSLKTLDQVVRKYTFADPSRTENR